MNLKDKLGNPGKTLRTLGATAMLGLATLGGADHAAAQTQNKASADTASADTTEQAGMAQIRDSLRNPDADTINVDALAENEMYVNLEGDAPDTTNTHRIQEINDDGDAITQYHIENNDSLSIQDLQGAGLLGTPDTEPDSATTDRSQQPTSKPSSSSPDDLTEDQIKAYQDGKIFSPYKDKFSYEVTGITPDSVHIQGLYEDKAGTPAREANTFSKPRDSEWLDNPWAKQAIQAHPGYEAFTDNTTRGERTTPEQQDSEPATPTQFSTINKDEAEDVFEETKGQHASNTQFFMLPVEDDADKPKFVKAQDGDEERLYQMVNMRGSPSDTTTKSDSERLADLAITPSDYVNMVAPAPGDNAPVVDDYTSEQLSDATEHDQQEHGEDLGMPPTIAVHPDSIHIHRPSPGQDAAFVSVTGINPDSAAGIVYRNVESIKTGQDTTVASPTLGYVGKTTGTKPVPELIRVDPLGDQAKESAIPQGRDSPIQSAHETNADKVKEALDPGVGHRYRASLDASLGADGSKSFGANVFVGDDTYVGAEVGFNETDNTTTTVDIDGPDQEGYKTKVTDKVNTTTNERDFTAVIGHNFSHGSLEARIGAEYSTTSGSRLERNATITPDGNEYLNGKPDSYSISNSDVSPEVGVGAYANIFGDELQVGGTVDAVRTSDGFEFEPTGSIRVQPRGLFKEFN